MRFPARPAQPREPARLDHTSPSPLGFLFSPIRLCALACLPFAFGLHTPQSYLYAGSWRSRARRCACPLGSREIIDERGAVSLSSRASSRFGASATLSRVARSLPRQCKGLLCPPSCRVLRLTTSCFCPRHRLLLQGSVRSPCSKPVHRGLRAYGSVQCCLVQNGCSTRRRRNR